jgi:glutamyl-tRNA synthetase
MVLGKDRTRLSKRHGATSVTAYREMGFLPEAMINYLVRLGWSHGDQEFFTRQELIDVFNLEAIGRAAGVFDPDKLAALNADHIKASPAPKLVESLRPFMAARGVELVENATAEKVVASLGPRSKTLVEMADQALFYYQDAIPYEPDAARKFLTPDALPALKTLTPKLEVLEDYTEHALEEAFKAVMAETGLKLGKIAQPVRVALSGRTASPGIFEITAIIGKKKTLERLRRAIEFIEGK